MDSTENDVAARGRALFDQLRAMRGRRPGPEAGEHTDEAAPSDEPASSEESTEAAGEPGGAEASQGSDPAAPTDPGAGAVSGAAVSAAGGGAESAPTSESEDPAGLASLADLAETPPPSAEAGNGSEPSAPDAGAPAPSAGTAPPAAADTAPDGGSEAAPIDQLPSLPALDPDVVPLAEQPDASKLGHPAADLPLPRVLAIANQKGGVGKTTTTVNLGAALAELGYRVLVVDLDPQGNATTGLGINARNLEHSIYDVVMHELPMDECIEPTSVRNLFVAPATIDLAGAEIELVPAFSRELRLRRALADTADAYDFTLIDCPPSLGLLTVNGLAAASEVLVPIQCEYYALEGLSQLLRNINLVQSNLNPPLVLSAIILTMYDARTKLADQVAAEVRNHFGATVCRHVVPRTVRLSEAPSFGQPIIVFDPSSRGALAYRELAKEVSGGAPQRVG